MHVRFSTVRGAPVIADSGEETVGTLSGLLLHPDLGTVEGFFVRTRGILRTEELFLSVRDILHWGKSIQIHDAGVLLPLEEHVRLHRLAEEGRTILGQRILTESGTAFGVCRDVQFETKTFRLEWLFPKKWMRWRPGIPVTAIVEVRPDAVIVHDALLEERSGTKRTVLQTLDRIAEAPGPPRLPEAS